MNLFELKTQIMLGKVLDNFFIFTGNELEVMNVYIHKLQEVGKYDKINYVEEPSDVISLFDPFSLMPCNDLVVMFDPELDTKTLQQIKKSVPDTAMFIVIIPSPLAWIKTDFETFQIDFKNLTEPVFCKHIQELLPGFTQENSEKLPELCGNVWGLVLREIDKIKTYSVCSGKDYNSCFTDMLLTGAILDTVSISVFDIVNAVVHKRSKQAVELVHKYLSQSAEVLGILALLYEAVKRALAVKSSIDTYDASKQLNLPVWQVRQVEQYEYMYSTKELLDNMRYIVNVDVGIKSGGYDQKTALWFVLFKILGR